VTVPLFSVGAGHADVTRSRYRVLRDDLSSIEGPWETWRLRRRALKQPSLLEQATIYYARATALQPPERNIVADPRALVTAGHLLQEMAPNPKLKARLEEFERYVDGLEQRLEPAA